MEKIPFHVTTETDIGEKLACSLCLRKTDEFYSPILEGVDDETWELLEKIASIRGLDIVEFGLCQDCFVNTLTSRYIDGKRPLKLVLDDNELLDIIEKAESIEEELTEEG